jgi:type I restriction enzyme R subunit
VPALKYYFKAYITDGHIRQILDNKEYTALNTNSTLGMADYTAVPEPWRSRVPEYVKDYVSLNTFA